MRRVFRIRRVMAAAGVAASAVTGSLACAQSLFNTQDDFAGWADLGNNINPPNSAAVGYNASPGGTVAPSNSSVFDSESGAYDGLGSISQGSYANNGAFTSGSSQAGLAGTPGSATVSINAENAATNPGSAFWNIGMSQNLIQNTDATVAMNGADYFAVDFNVIPNNSAGTDPYFELKMVQSFDGQFATFTQLDAYDNQGGTFNPMGIAANGNGIINNGSYWTEYFPDDFINSSSTTFLNLGLMFNSDYNATAPVKFNIDNLRVVAPAWHSGSGNWSNANNWTTFDTQQTPNNQGLEADFLNYVASNTTVSVSSATDIGTIMFNDPSSSYTLSPTGNGEIIMNMPGLEPALIDDRAGKHTISTPLLLATNTVISGTTATVFSTNLCINVVNSGDVLHISGAIFGAGGLDVNGASTLGLSDSGAGGTLAAPSIGVGSTTNGLGTVSLESPNSYAGGTTVTSGTLVAAVAGALPNGKELTNFGTTDINGNQVLGAPGNSALSGTGILNIGNGTTAVTLHLAIGSGGANQGHLNIAPRASLDVGNNFLILNDPGSSIDATIQSYLRDGYNGGDWNGTSTTGGSIVTSAPTGAKFGIGYADGADGLNPNISSGQLEVAYALYGDITLQGFVGGTDLSIFATHFGATVSGGWRQDDFNSDGVVNAQDFALLAGNFGDSASGAPISLPQSDWNALYSFAAANGLEQYVPEPCSIGLLVFGSLGLLNRRRRRLA